ncbi:MAG: hypothetical protein ACOC93_04195 [Planctomycetota bacterium]
MDDAMALLRELTRAYQADDVPAALAGSLRKYGMAAEGPARDLLEAVVEQMKLLASQRAAAEAIDALSAPPEAAPAGERAGLLAQFWDRHESQPAEMPLLLLRNGREMARWAAPGRDRLVVELRTGGHYQLALESGRVLWSAQVAEEDLRQSDRPGPLRLAARTQSEWGEPLSACDLPDGGGRVELFAGSQHAWLVIEPSEEV